MILFLGFCFSSVQLFSHVWLFATPWIAARQASLSITNSRSLLKLKFIKSVMPSSHLILSCPLLLLPPVPPSIRVFSNESTLRVRWPKYWSFSFSISPSNEHPGLISFRMDWLDLFAVQGTLESSPTPQFKSINFSGFCSPTYKVDWNLNFSIEIFGCNSSNWYFQFFCWKIPLLTWNLWELKRSLFWSPANWSWIADIHLREITTM